MALAMESATLTNPQRRSSVHQPVQKCLSLPSYAKASGEGIDHRLIFAAVEQKEKIRRKSKIFKDKEKSGSRQNYFCLPLTSNGRCKETSLSSDTSCSSVEYQKPKTSAAKSKKNQSQQTHPKTEVTLQKPRKAGQPAITKKTDGKEISGENGDCVEDVTTESNELPVAFKKSGIPESNDESDNKFSGVPHPESKNSLTKKVGKNVPEVANVNNSGNHSKVTEDGSSGRQISKNGDSGKDKKTLDIPRSAVGSSDSLERMERSSRSSNDSLSRRERREAVKARVEAEREKYIDSSSDDDTTNVRKTKGTNDGTGPRTVREVKTKSLSRAERNSRRKSQEEQVLNKVRAKNQDNKDGEKPMITQNAEVKDCNVSSDISLTDVLNDFEKSMQPLPKKQKVNENLQLLPSREFLPYDKETDDAKLRLAAAVPIMQNKGYCDVKAKNHLRDISVNPRNLLHRDQIIRKTSVESFSARSIQSTPAVASCQAPTPPPRSPKSMIFLNKMFLNQCKNMNTSVNSLMKKQGEFSFSQGASCASSMKSFDYLFQPERSKVSEIMDYSSITRRNKECMKSRRKTCSNFPWFDSMERARISEREHQSVLEDFSTSNPNLSNRLSFGDFASNRNHCCESNSTFSHAWDPENKGSRSNTYRNGYEPLKIKNTLPYGERQPLHKDFICSSCRFRCRDRSELTVRSNLCISGEVVETTKCRPVSSDRLETSSLESLDLPNNQPAFASFLKTSDRLSKSEANLLRHAEAPGLNTNHSSFVMSPIKLHRSYETAITKSSNVRPNADIVSNSRLCDESLILDCAMEELQNVYKSLNESDESISELKQASNMHVKDDYMQNSKPIPSSHCTTHAHSKLVEVPSLPNSALTGCNTSESVRLGESTVSANKPLQRHVSDNSIKSDHGKSILPASPAEPLGIAELFDNLTMQLDFEQKALEESRLRKVCSPCSFSDYPSKKDVKGEIPPCRSSSVGLPKAAKTTENRDVLDSKDAISAQKEPDSKQRCLARKKRKAVRSYSANIACLLQPLDDAVLSDNVFLQMERPQSASLDFLEPERPYHQIDSSKSDSHEVSGAAENPVACQKNLNTQDNSPQGNLPCGVKAGVELKPQNERCLTPNKKSDEIWEIRVSMDSRNKSEDTGASGGKSNTDNRNLRLHSAVLQTNKDSKIQQTTASRSTRHPTHMRSFSSVPLDDGELDRLLASLLNDVSKVIEATTESTLVRNNTCSYVKPQEKSRLCSSDGRKGTSEDVKVTRGPCSSKMDQCLSSQNGGKLEENEAGNLNLHYYTKNLENSSCLLDNDSRKNNNAEIPSTLQTSTENVITSGLESCAKHNIEPHLQSLQRSRPAPLPPCKLPLSVTHGDKCGVRNQNIRRHSVGGDDMITEEINSRCGSFFTLEKRFQTIAYPVNPPCQSPSWKTVCSSHNNYNSKERSFQVCQPSFINEKQSSAMLSKTSITEKPKDKSYKRKSSLNRVDFVQTSPSVAGGDSHVTQSSEPRTEFFTSDENECISNKDASGNVPSFASVKRKNQLASTKDSASIEKRAAEGSVKMKAPYYWKMHRGLPRGKNRAPSLEKRSHSAGEQESTIDYNENGYPVNPCLSAQEIDYCRSHCHQDSCHIHNTENYEHINTSTLPQSLQGRKTTWHMSTASHEVLSVSRHIHLSCDTTTSQTESLAVTPRSSDQVNYFSEVTVKHSNSPIHRNEVELLIDSSVKDNSTELDSEKSGTVGNDGTPSDRGTADEEFKNSVVTICSGVENSLKLDEKNSSSLCCSIRENHSDCEVNKSVCRMKFPISHSDPEEHTPEKRDILEMIEVTSLSCSEKDLSRQPSSILRRHHHEEKKGLQGILKHSGDEKLTRHPPSILKHRESSEEKDSYHPADLHSILKKSSEDESTHSSNPDIRPILKNSSTEEDSPLNATKPRPILKKRTSFSDEFSYTSLSNELKPILKKKIQIDSSEEQPKPILKTRRKSEEAGSSEAMAASLGARPRANSADLIIKPILKNQHTKGSSSASSSSVLINTSDSES